MIVRRDPAACIACKLCTGYTVSMSDRPQASTTITPSQIDESRPNFADKYRPDTFDKVFGQESAVDCLSGLIARGRIGRSILLHGAVGSGKTTLARIYARALNCQAPDPSSSPCYRCPACGASAKHPVEGFEEYNVSRDGGGKDAVERFLKQHHRPARGGRFRILFFDEAHTLSKQACDLLLNPVEEPEHGVLFFLATTEVEKIRPALRSRLFDLLIRPLSAAQAIEFLRRAAEKERIEHEPGALELLAGLRNGYPRDLLLGLERVHERDSPRLTVAQVRAAFDVDQTEVLVAYFQALAEGNLGRQTSLAFGWQESAADKIRWVQAFLISLYHNQILHRRLVVDGVIEAIPESARAPILGQFCRRLGLDGPEDLEPFWRRLIAFWPVPDTAADETALGLRLTMFHQLVNDASAPDPSDTTKREVLHEPAALMASATEVLCGFGPPPAPRPGTRAVADQAGFLAAADGRRIVNAASFLVQEYGIYFNAAFEIRPAELGIRETTSAVAAIAAFRDELAAQTQAWGGGLRATLTLLERDAIGVVGRLVAHVNTPNPLDPADPEGTGRTTGWARGWRYGGAGVGVAVDLLPASAGEKAALKFHWARTLTLCAGLDPTFERWDPATGAHRSLLKLLRVPPRGARKLLDHPLVDAPPPLSNAAIAEACRHRLEPLSAFDDGAWGWIANGWELQEFHERQATRAERAHAIAGLRQRYGENTPEAGEQVASLVRHWPSNPRARRRRWRGWWAS